MPVSIAGRMCALVCFLVALAASGAAASPLPDRLADGAIVVAARNGDDVGMGAGTIVAVTGTLVRAVTAAHVATYGSLRVRVGTVEVPARLVSVVAGHDLAVIEADVDEATAAGLHAVPVARPRERAAVHIWGSGYGGPAREAAAVTVVGGNLPDGPARGRIALACAACHQGDSGGGVIDERGDLVGVFVGYFTLESGRVSVAELPGDALRLALAAPMGPKTTRSNTSATPATIVASNGSEIATRARNVASTSVESASAMPGDGSPTAILAAVNPAK